MKAKRIICTYIEPKQATKRARKAPVASEHAEQKALCDFWRLYSKSKGLDERLLFAIPNAAKRSYKLAAYLKAEGLRAGCPDMFLAMPKFVRGCQPQELMFAGLFLELKRKGAAKPPKTQLEFADMLRRQGYNVVICQGGADEAIRAIRAYLA